MNFFSGLVRSILASSALADVLFSSEAAEQMLKKANRFLLTHLFVCREKRRLQLERELFVYSRSDKRL